MVTAKIVKIGKKEANEILNRNTKNRKVVNSNYSFIKDQIQNDEFVLNGSSIVVAEDGVLLDGQHRLLALSETDKKIEVVLVENIPNSAMATIDTGAVRKASDVLSINGITNSKNVAAVIRNVVEEFGAKRKLAENKKGSVKLSNKEVVEYSKNLIFHDSLDFVTTLYNGNIRVISPAQAAAFYILFSREDKQKARSFVRELFTGKMEFISNSAQLLRNRLVDNKMRKISLAEATLRDLTITAFRKYKEDVEVKRLIISKQAFFQEV